MAKKPTRSTWPFVLIALVAIGLYLYASVEAVDNPSNSRPRGGLAELEGLGSRDDTNVLFILIDTLRADRMSAYGYERDTTPFLSKLASSGIRFDRNISQSSWTKSSMASMWTGLTPIGAGVTKFDDTISSQIEMPAEILEEAGFKTVGLYRNGWVSGYFGFDQGFEKYYRPMGQRVQVAAQRLRPNSQAYGSDENLIADAIEFLRLHGESDRWFLYLHLMDLHEYTYDEESALFGSSVADLYDNSILRTDWVVSRLYEYMADRGLLDDTIVVVLSDHGEAFGERGIEGHARAVFPETTETPLIVSLPFEIESGITVPSKTTNMDVWPTLLDLMNLKIPAQGDGQSRKPEITAGLRGESDEGAEPGDASFAFLDENWGRPNTEQTVAISVLEGRFRYVAGTDLSGRRFEVLLSTEDGQEQDQSKENPEVFARLQERAKEELASSPAYEADEIALDELQLDQLRALGYKLP